MVPEALNSVNNQVHANANPRMSEEQENIAKRTRLAHDDEFSPRKKKGSANNINTGKNNSISKNGGKTVGGNGEESPHKESGHTQR